MTVGANGEVVGGGFRTLAVAEPVRVKLGREIRAQLTEAPSGRPMLTVREWITPDGYPTDTPIPKKAGAKRRMNRTAFIERHGVDGCPDKFRGLSGLTASQVEALIDALAPLAIELAELELADGAEA